MNKFEIIQEKLIFSIKSTLIVQATVPLISVKMLPQFFNVKYNVFNAFSLMKASH